MSLTLGLVLAVTLLAACFAASNGFHDASNAVATSIATRALTPRIALVLATVMNFAGAFLGTEVGRTVQETITPARADRGLVLLVAALVGALAWNLITWWWGCPSSSTYALVGGLVGAALVGRADVAWGHLGLVVLLPLVLVPLGGFAMAVAMMSALQWSLRRQPVGRMHRGFTAAQTVSAAAMALGHGLQDAQKSMAVVILALVTAGYAGAQDAVPWWVVLGAATAMAAGTWAGGWRIIRTLGERITDLDPPRGFTAESIGSAALYAGVLFDAPVSSTHAITSAVAGAGATRRLSAVRWGAVRAILGVWAVTLPAAAAVAALVYGVLVLLLPV